MAVPSTAADFLVLVRKSGLLGEEALARLNDEDLPADAFACAERLVRTKVLTAFQAQQLMNGRFRGLVLGPYRILRLLGRGGMGAVYLADHADRDRKVALKVLPADKAADKLSLERFYREARAAAALDHPQIVRLYDVTQVNDVHFLVMEYVDGLDLQSLVAQTGPLHHAQAANYVAQAAAGLRHAHEKGFVHRDIKPANLILAKDGTVKILDMGLARSVGNPKDDLTSRYDENAATGTADFVSPEQALNTAPDARSDIYSLGATLFTLLAGQTPFNGSTTQKLAQHQLSAPPDLREKRPSVPPALAAVVARMMAKAPGDRYQTAGDVIEALAPWLAPAAGSGAAAADPPPEKATPREAAAPAGARRGPWIAAGVAFLLVVVVGAALALGRGKKPAETVQTPPNPAGEAPGPAPGGPPEPAPPGLEAPEVVVYRLDLSATKPFVHSNTGRTIDGQASFPGAPEGWGTHSWVTDCTHEFFAATRGGHPALGIRFTANSAANTAGMLYVGGVEVAPNRAYALRVVYQTTGGYNTGDVRIREQQTNRLRIVGQNRLAYTGGQWTTLLLPYKNGNTDKIQIEFHHNGPLGAENELSVRSLEVLDAEPR